MAELLLAISQAVTIRWQQELPSHEGSSGTATPSQTVVWLAMILALGKMTIVIIIIMIMIVAPWDHDRPLAAFTRGLGVSLHGGGVHRGRLLNTYQDSGGR